MWENVNRRGNVIEEEMREIYGYDMERFGTLDTSDKTIAILGCREWPQTAKQDGDRMSKQFYAIHRRSVISDQMSLLGVGTVLHLERVAWSLVKWLRQETDEYHPTPPPRLLHHIAHPHRPPLPPRPRFHLAFKNQPLVKRRSRGGARRKHVAPLLLFLELPRHETR